MHNTQYREAKQYNTVQHSTGRLNSTTQYNTVQGGYTVQHSTGGYTVQHSTGRLQSTTQYREATQYNTVQGGYTVQHSTGRLHSTTQYREATQYNTVQHSTGRLQSTTQYREATQYNTVQHSTGRLTQHITTQTVASEVCYPITLPQHTTMPKHSPTQVNVCVCVSVTHHGKSLMDTGWLRRWEDIVDTNSFRSDTGI